MTQRMQADMAVYKGLNRLVFENTGVRYTDSDIERWLLKQDVTLFTKWSPIHFKRNRVLVNKKDWQFQADLVDMSAIPQKMMGCVIY